MARGIRSKRPSLRAIFFDVDDTLFSTSDFAAIARRNSIEAMVRYGLKAEPEVILKELQEVVQEFSSNHEHHFEKLLSRIDPRAYAGTNPAILVAAAVVAYHETKFRQLHPYNDVLEVLGLIARADLVRGVITAGVTVKQAEKLVRLNVYPYLTPTAIFISDQIGIGKPNPKLYLRACQSVGVDPREAVYVGDNPAHDIDPANSIGMITILNRRSPKIAIAPGQTSPTHEIYDFWDLLKVLRETYRVQV